jgi:hypothetical protein
MCPPQLLLIVLAVLRATENSLARVFGMDNHENTKVFAGYFLKYFSTSLPVHEDKVNRIFVLRLREEIPVKIFRTFPNVPNQTTMLYSYTVVNWLMQTLKEEEVPGDFPQVRCRSNRPTRFLIPSALLSFI